MDRACVRACVHACASKLAKLNGLQIMLWVRVGLFSATQFAIASLHDPEGLLRLGRQRLLQEAPAFKINCKGIATVAGPEVVLVFVSSSLPGLGVAESAISAGIHGGLSTESI